MNEINNKILNLIKNHNDFKEKLFLFSKEQGDFSVFFNEENDYNDINWLYKSRLQSATLVGIDDSTNEVVAIDDEGFLVEVCLGLENIPYEFIRIGCQLTETETVKEYFSKYKKIESILKEYEQWCKNNNIELDKEKVYHDESGNLFNEYFDKY